MTRPSNPTIASRRPHAGGLRRIMLPLACGVALVAIPGRAWPAPTFPNMAHTVGGDPVAVAAGDLDGDGRIDLVVANRWTEDLSILMSRGDGSFAAERRFDAGGIPVALALADFDGDDRDDIAAALPVEDRIVVFLSQADGMPGPPLTLVAGDSPGALLAADLNGDGATDVAVANYFSDDVMVFRGQGDGAFMTPMVLPVGRRPGDLVAGLFNADLRPDMAVANQDSGDVTLLLGDGFGGFSRGGDYDTSAYGSIAAPRRIVTADFDGDGAFDLAVGNFDNVEEYNAVVLLPGRGDGSFEAGYFARRAGDGAFALGAADFNHDGRPDLAFGAHHGATCCDLRDGRIILGRGDLTFDDGGAYRSGPGPVALAAAHLDGDPSVDLAVISDARWDQVSVNLGRGDGTMGRDPAVLDPGSTPRGVALGDVDGDGRLDIITANPFDARLRLMRSAVGGGFEEPVSLDTGGFPDLVLAGDFNGDHLDDLAALDPITDAVVLFMANGGGLFTGPARLRPGTELRGLSVAEVNGDGIDDLLVAGDGAGGEVMVLAGSGAGPASPLHLPAGMPYPRALVGADVNGDGLQDIVVAGLPLLAVLVAVAPGQFAPPAIVETGSFGPSRLAAADINRDGRADVVVSQDGGARLYAGRADGGLDPGPAIGLPTWPRALVLTDVDSDGAPDLLALDDVSVNSDVSLAVQVTVPGVVPDRLLFGADGTAMAAGDLDGDGRVDLVVADALRGIVLSLNQGRFPNRPPRALPASASNVECAGPGGALVVLDGRASADPDSTPGTQDDLASFAWYEDHGLPSERLLAEGPVVEVPLPMGAHALTLVVVDRAGATAAQGFTMEVVDTTPPAVTALIAPGALWPPDHRMVAVHADLSAADVCGGEAAVILESVASSEPDDAAGVGDGATLGDVQDAALGTGDVDVTLRAERDARSPGRVYTLTWRVTDAAGNSTRAVASVTVPRMVPRRASSGPGNPAAPRDPNGRRNRTPERPGF